jgi:hypothetical protein
MAFLSIETDHDDPANLNEFPNLQNDATVVSTNETRNSRMHNPNWTFRTDDDFAVLAVRNLVLDICMQNGGGHGGSALGMAAIGVALWKYTMRYNPCDPQWFDRDRFVLSNGELILIDKWNFSNKFIEHV